MSINRLLALIILCCGIVLPTAIGSFQPNYSHASQYLSELGAQGAPYRNVINPLAFLIVGLVVPIILLRLRLALPRRFTITTGLILLGGLSVGYLAAFFYPCDVGCPLEGGSHNQDMHNLSSVIAYSTAPLGLYVLTLGFALGKQWRYMTVALLASIIITGALAALVTPELAASKGIAQRFVDFTFFVWMGVMLIWVPLTQIRK